MTVINTIVWDFDGVFNCEIVDGEYIWQQSFEDEFGHSSETFRDMIFNDRFHDVLSGDISLLDVLADWAGTVGYHGDLRNVIELWFQTGYDLDAKVMNMLARSKLRNVMGTNNEAMRTQFIAEDLGFADRMDRIFASGLMGVAKPDAGFFDMVADELSLEPAQLILIDDRQDNCEAAEANGWQAHWFDGGDYDGLSATLRGIGAIA